MKTVAGNGNGNSKEQYGYSETGGGVL